MKHFHDVDNCHGNYLIVFINWVFNHYCKTIIKFHFKLKSNFERLQCGQIVKKFQDILRIFENSRTRTAKKLTFILNSRTFLLNFSLKFEENSRIQYYTEHLWGWLHFSLLLACQTRNWAMQRQEILPALRNFQLRLQKIWRFSCTKTNIVPTWSSNMKISTI
jgi:hypothetical protein